MRLFENIWTKKKGGDDDEEQKYSYSYVDICECVTLCWIDCGYILCICVWW